MFEEFLLTFMAASLLGLGLNFQRPSSRRKLIWVGGYSLAKDENRPPIGEMVKLKIHSHAAKPEIYALFECDGVLLWIPSVRRLPILPYGNGEFYSRNVTKELSLLEPKYKPGDAVFRMG